jgi:hypothetical protein
MYKENAFAILSFVSAIVGMFVKSGNVYLGFALAFSAIVLFAYYLYLLKVKVKEVNLDAHPFWNRMSYYSKFKLPYLQIVNPVRRRVFWIAMKIHLAIAVREVRKSLKGPFNPNLASDLINNITSSYEKEWRDLNIPENFIRKFNYFHKPRIKYIGSYISFICTSNFYRTDQEKKVALLDGMLHLFQWTILDIERTNDSINGPLDKELQKLHDNGLI